VNIASLVTNFHSENISVGKGSIKKIEYIYIFQSSTHMLQNLPSERCFWDTFSEVSSV